MPNAILLVYLMLVATLVYDCTVGGFEIARLHFYKKLNKKSQFSLTNTTKKYLRASSIVRNFAMNFTHSQMLLSTP